MTATFDLTAFGFHANVFSDSGNWAIAPVTGTAGSGPYAAFRYGSVPLTDLGLDHDEDGVGAAAAKATTPALASGATRITLRIAVAATAEWTALVGGTQAAGLAKVVSFVNYAEGVYDTELKIGFQLVSGTNLVYTSASTDPYTNTDNSAMLAQNQANVDTVIGNANYDIGQVFGTDGGGVSTVASATRSFPETADVLANRSDADELLPQVSRVADPLTFRLTTNGWLILDSTLQTVDAAGTGVHGSVGTFEFYRLFGDADGDRGVSVNDFNAFATAFGATGGSAAFDARFDFDGDNGISINDFNQFATRFGVVV